MRVLGQIARSCDGYDDSRSSRHSPTADRATPWPPRRFALALGVCACDHLDGVRVCLFSPISILFRLVVMRSVLVSCTAALLFATEAPAQMDRASVGLLVGSVSAYGQGRLGDPVGTTGRQLTIGVPVRIRLTSGERSSLGLAAAVEWSYASASSGTDGILQTALGPDFQWMVRGPVDVRLAALLGLVQQRDDWTDDDSHAQYGLQTGVGFRAGRWRFGYSYLHARVVDVRRKRGMACPTGQACTLAIDLGPPETLPYDRHGISVTRLF